MTALDPNLAEEFAAFEERYWKALQTTLELVFEAGPGLAAHYRRGLINAPPLQRALALHDDPLDIASTLTGKSLTADRVALYDAIMRSSVEMKRFAPDDILSRARRDESAPLVTVRTLNKFMGELGYDRLTIRSGAAYFSLLKKAWKRPLPKRHYMNTLPGLTADREEVYGLDRILNMLNGLQEFARQRKPTSSIIARIERLKARLLLAHSSPS
jgi:hypothetical protein